ncbi:MAG: DUF3089 domain-containing protein [Spirochaetaceae bacterium]|nr:DUF3089 domain-containing protein [Spirochaetaceae bacterium]
MKQSNCYSRLMRGIILTGVLLVAVLALCSCATKQDPAPDQTAAPSVPDRVIDVNRYALTPSSLSATDIKNPATSYVPDPAGLDYRDRNNWFILPSRKTSNIDVFLIYPTLILDDEKPDFIPADDADLREKAELWVADTVSPVFAGLNVNIYMPKYRQLNGKAFGKSDRDTLLQWIKSIPKTDIYNAFDFYLKNMNNFHQYIMFSHSQGSLLNGVLMSEFASRYESPDVQKLMLCSYMIGYALGDEFLSASPYKPSQTADDLNTLVSWNTATKSEVAGDKIRMIWGDETAVAVNPITFMANGDAVPAARNGVSIMNYFGDLTAVQVDRGLTGAQVVRPRDRGGAFGGQLVLIDLDETSFLSPGAIAYLDSIRLGFSHTWDITLFAGALRNNIIQRLNLKANP